jgi:hypothetical protein
MSQSIMNPPNGGARRPRRANRIAPFVVLVGLVVYAVMMFAMLTAPASAKASPAPASVRSANIDSSDSTPWVTPSMPARCTDAQIASGDVVSCVISKYSEPAARGWGTPPMPFNADGSANPGWKWLGWSYTGSTALRAWEQALWKNAGRIGSIKAGAVQSPAGALVLFEGFLAEVQAKGYKIRDVIGYNFRCTSNTRKDCVGLDAKSLSNHSWGLAIDFNVGANPEIRYAPSAENGATTACAVPMRTDIPKWVVDVAQKWGLLWGGYGWNGGCASPSAQKSSILRDPMHFEFRGTTDDAVAIARFNGASVTRYCSNQVEGTTTVRACAWADRPQAGWRTPIVLQAPAGATAALVNITLTGSSTDAFVTAERCDVAVSGERAWSNGNVSKGATVANLAVVPLDSLGRFCIYNSHPMHVIVDAQGFFLPSRVAGPASGRFTLVTPTRVLDTRKGDRCDAAGACRLGGRASTTSLNGVPVPQAPAGSTSLLANVTVTDTAANGGFLTADSCESLAARGQTSSNLNFGSNDIVSNLAIVTMGNVGATRGFCTATTGDLHQIIDVQGAFSPAGQWGLTLTPQTRLVDTRKCHVDGCGVRRPAGGILRLTAPAGASAVLVNITLTDSLGSGYVQADKCSALKPSTETASNANVVPGRTAANLAVVPVDADGSFCLFTSAATHMIVDIQGSFSSTGDLRFVSMNAERRFDSRQNAG